MLQSIINNCSVNYEVFGEGLPIIFLHGYRLDKDSLKKYFESNFKPKFKNKFKRIYIDLPGMGESTASKNITKSEDMLNCLNIFLENTIGNEKFLMIGQSYGGYLAQGLLKFRKNQIEGLFLMCPVVKAVSKERALPTQSKHIISGYNKIPADKNFKGFLNNNVKINPHNWYRYQNEIVKGLYKGNHSFLNDLESTGYQFDFELELFQNSFEKPTYILLGRQDLVVGFSDMLFFPLKFINCNFHIINNAGHNIQIDQSGLVIHLFNCFLEEISSDRCS